MSAGSGVEPDRVGVVIATRDRRHSVLETIERLRDVPEAPPVVVVDNGSSDGTVAAIRSRWPDVDAVSLPSNLGAAARTVGARRLETPYMAFSDDDSWWAPGALARAADHLDRHPSLALVAARILVGPDERLDPTCAEMAASPLDDDRGLPGATVLGFVACGAVVRRSAFLDVGGFHGRLGVGGEEGLLALDLASAGWGLAYLDDVVAHHHPSQADDRDSRRSRQLRNSLWSAWLRRPLPGAVRQTARLIRPIGRDRAVPGALAGAVRGVPWIVRERRVVPDEVERGLRRLEDPRRSGGVRPAEDAP